MQKRVFFKCAAEGFIVGAAKTLDFGRSISIAREAKQLPRDWMQKDGQTIMADGVKVGSSRARTGRFK